MQLLQSTSDIRPAEEVSDRSRLRPTNGFLVIRLCKQNEKKNPRLGALSSEKKRWKGWVGARGPNDVARIIWSLSRGSPGENCMGLFGRTDSDCILRTAAEGCGDYPETKGKEWASSSDHRCQAELVGTTPKTEQITLTWLASCLWNYTETHSKVNWWVVKWWKRHCGREFFVSGFAEFMLNTIWVKLRFTKRMVE